MSPSLLPDSYPAWRRCIEIDCRIPLELNYIRRRLKALEDAGDFHTQQFVSRWGEAHRQRVVGWFKQAADELGVSTTA